jgi:hypothetical protein
VAFCNIGMLVAMVLCSTIFMVAFVPKQKKLYLNITQSSLDSGVEPEVALLVHQSSCEISALIIDESTCLGFPLAVGVHI